MSQIEAKEIKWKSLLEQAVKEPGTVSKAYSAFWNYSTGNQLLAAIECALRNIPIGPLASFMGWKEKGRHVKKGEKAIGLWMPVTRKRKATDDKPTDEAEAYTTFIFRNHWFVLAQTDGADYQPEPVPGWSKEQALSVLDIAEMPFSETNGNIQGYAIRRQVAINPLAQHPHRTLMHELAHVVLGHTAEMMSDSERTPRNLEEAEAEATAMLVCESLGLPGADEARGYIQGWLRGEAIPDSSARRIFGAADKILKAGRPSAK